MKQLIASTPMTYATRRLAAGDPFDATSRDARLLVAIRRARHATDEDAKKAFPIPANWRDLPWSPAEAGGASLRALAAEVSADPVRNKSDAIAAIEAELIRRAKA